MFKVSLVPERKATPVLTLTPLDVGGMASFDVVMSDMAPWTTGARFVDQCRSFDLYVHALNVESTEQTVAAIKKAETLNFFEFWQAYEEVVRKSRSGELTADDYAHMVTEAQALGLDHARAVLGMQSDDSLAVHPRARYHPHRPRGMRDQALLGAPARERRPRTWHVAGTTTSFRSSCASSPACD